MLAHQRRNTFESLEKRLALAVTASVSAGGDLLVSGDADGPVVITSTGNGGFTLPITARRSARSPASPGM